MECTRCNIALIEGNNIHKGWHIPVCMTCRKKLLDSNDLELTDKEKDIMNKRFREEKKIR